MELERIFKQQNGFHILCLNHSGLIFHKDVDNVGRILTHGNQLAHFGGFAGGTADQVAERQTDGDTGQNGAGDRFGGCRGECFIDVGCCQLGAIFQCDCTDPFNCLNSKAVP